MGAGAALSEPPIEIMSSCTPEAPEAIQRTDGSIFAGSEVKVVDIDGNEVPAGTVGDLLMRGPGVVFGYFDRPDATQDAFLPGLWFRTGDRAGVDENGWLSLHGRTKDIIIRGGENIPVTDVESVIFDHPDILNTAVIGVPDERLGERVCAVVVLEEGAPALTVDTLAKYLLAIGANAPTVWTSRIRSSVIGCSSSPPRPMWSWSSSARVWPTGSASVTRRSRRTTRAWSTARSPATARVVRSLLEPATI